MLVMSIGAGRCPSVCEAR